jgi:hypothetical protein
MAILPGAPVATAGDEAVFLIGRPPLAEFLAFVRNQTVGGQQADMRALADEWRAANDHIQALEAEEAGLADGVQAQELPAALADMAKAVLASPMTQRAFSIVPVRIGMVELDRLVVFQKYINLRYVAELRQQLGDRPSNEELFEFCLPLHANLPQVRMAPVQNGFVFLSPSMDFRLLEVSPIDPGQIQGYVTQGWPAAIIAVAVGYGTNFLQVVEVEGRLVLGNGSHRAYTLRELGVSHVPALVQVISRKDELPAIGIQDLQQNSDIYLKAERPPLLKDYFDDQLRRTFPVPRTAMQVRVLIVPEPMVTPI